MAADKRNNSHVSNYEFMETIRKYESIYNPNWDDHKPGQIEKKQAWQTVAAELNMSVTEVHSRYLNVRTVFSRYLKSLRLRSGEGTVKLGSNVRLRDCFEYLRWLIVFIKPRNVVSSKRKALGEEGERDVNSERASEAEDDEAEELWEGEFTTEGCLDPASEQTGSIIDQPNIGNLPSTSKMVLQSPSSSIRQGFRTPRTWSNRFKPKTKRVWSSMGKRLREGPREGPRTGANAFEANETFAANAEDEDALFCMSLAPKMRRLPERFKTAAQLRILQVICDFEMSDASSPHQLPSQTVTVFPQGGAWSVPSNQAEHNEDNQPTSM